MLIIDSDVVTAKGLQLLIAETSGNISTKYCGTAESAIDYAINNKVDLFVVGIKSDPNDVGQLFARQIINVKEYRVAYFIFLASSADVEFCRVIADDFCYSRLLTLPISEHKFTETLLTLSEYQITKRDNSYITLIHDKNEQHICRSDILWVSVENRVISVHLINNTVEKYPQGVYPLKNLSIMLGPGFIQIFKSDIVNISYVESIDYENKTLKLAGVERVFRLGNAYIPNIKMCFNKNNNGAEYDITTNFGLNRH